MADLAMRPLSLGEILDRSFAILRARFGAMFVTGIICFIIPMAMVITTLPELSRTMVLPPGTRTTDPQFNAVLGAMGHLMWIGLVGFVCLVVARGAWIHEAAETLAGRTGGLGPSLRFSLRLSPAMAGLGLLEGVILFGAYLLIAVPAVLIASVGVKLGGVLGVLAVIVVVAGGAALLLWIYAGLFVSAPALLLDEPVGQVFHALERGWRLSRGRRGAIIGILFLVLVLAIIVQIAVTVIAGLWGGLSQGGAESIGPMVLVVYGAVLLVQVAIGLLVYVIQTVMYYDLLVRREGFDLKVMAQSLPQG